MYSLDITKAYGSESLVPLDRLPYYVLKASDYGFTSLDSDTVASALAALESGPLKTALDWLSDKLGYDHVNSSRRFQGLVINHFWALINTGWSSAKHFFCQTTKNSSAAEVTACFVNKDKVLRRHSVLLG